MRVIVLVLCLAVAGAAAAQEAAPPDAAGGGEFRETQALIERMQARIDGRQRRLVDAASGKSSTSTSRLPRRSR